MDHKDELKHIERVELSEPTESSMSENSNFQDSMKKRKEGKVKRREVIIMVEGENNIQRVEEKIKTQSKGPENEDLKEGKLQITSEMPEEEFQDEKYNFT